MNLCVRPITSADADWISTRLRPADNREIEAATGRGAADVVPLSASVSDECYTIRAGESGMPCVIFGATADPSSKGWGLIWLLATPEIRTCNLELIDESRFWLEHFTSKYELGIHNWISEANGLHARWAALCGFEQGATYRIRGTAFRHTFRSNKEAGKSCGCQVVL